MIWLLLIVGLLFVGFIHLIIPICVAASGKLHKQSSLWWIAIAGGLLGFVVCALMQEEFRGLAGIIQSIFWTIIGFFILKGRCYKRHNKDSYQTHANIVEKHTDLDIDKMTPKEAAEYLVAEQLGEKYIPEEKPSPQQNIKNQYCSKCGSLINSENKKCTGCGKQYFKVSVIKIIIVTLLIAVLVLIAVLLTIGRPLENNNSETLESTNESSTVPYYSELGLSYSQYQLAKKVAYNTTTYCEYIAEIKSMVKKATYSEELKKEKVIDYLNALSLDYGQKIILYRIQFPNDNTYNSDIVDYLNEREDISYDDMVFILEELGFAVFSDGTVKW